MTGRIDPVSEMGEVQRKMRPEKNRCNLEEPTEAKYKHAKDGG